MNETTQQYFDLHTSGFRPYVKRQYQREIERFEAWAEKDFMEAEPEDADAYRSSLLETKAPTTVAKIMHILSSFGEYLGNEISWNNVFYRVSGGVTYLDYEEVRFPSRPEVDAFLNALGGISRSVEMAARITYATGCKLDELLKLNLNDVEYDEINNRAGLVFHNYPPFQLRRPVTLPSYLTDAFLNYLRPFQNEPPESPLFLNTRHERLSRWTCRWACEKTGSDITFAKLKTMSMISLTDLGAGTGEIAQYCGRTGRWLSRYRKATLKPSLFDQKGGGTQ